MPPTFGVFIVQENVYRTVITARHRLKNKITRPIIGTQRIQNNILLSREFIGESGNTNTNP